MEISGEKEAFSSSSFFFSDAKFKPALTQPRTPAEGVFFFLFFLLPWHQGRQQKKPQPPSSSPWT
jgi:hypothetical protein